MLQLIYDNGFKNQCQANYSADIQKIHCHFFKKSCIVKSTSRHAKRKFLFWDHVQISKYLPILHEMHQIHMKNPVSLLKQIVGCNDVLRIIIPNHLKRSVFPVAPKLLIRYWRILSKLSLFLTFTRWRISFSKISCTTLSV